MNAIEIAKGVLGTITAIGVGNIVGNVVKATTPAGLNLFNRASISFGSFIIGGVITDHAVRYLNAELDNLLIKKEELPVEILDKVV
jgi:hypothetical protein